MTSDNDEWISILFRDEDVDGVREQRPQFGREAPQVAAFRVRMLAEDDGGAGVDNVLKLQRVKKEWTWQIMKVRSFDDSEWSLREGGIF